MNVREVYKNVEKKFVPTQPKREFELNVGEVVIQATLNDFGYGYNTDITIKGDGWFIAFNGNPDIFPANIKGGLLEMASFLKPIIEASKVSK
jgi:hypothetical protein